MRRKVLITPLLRENFNVAIKSIKSNKLRSVLTILIIGIGITSLVGILTATDSLKKQVYSNFEKFGTNSFIIRSNYYSSSNEVRQRKKNSRNINYFQAQSFKQNFKENAVVSVFCNAVNGATAKYGSESTNPNVLLVAADEDYISFNNSTIQNGRGLTDTDIKMASFSCVIGEGVRKALFKNVNPVGKVITISGIRYNVIGVLTSIGSSFGSGGDNIIIIPITNARSYFVSESTSYRIGVLPKYRSENMSDIYDKAESVFRSVRRLSPIDQSDFRLSKSESFMGQMNQIMKVITIVSVAIGLITLLGAAVALMNIMLVSVKERTNEIGTRKAIGASAKTIKQQFLFEAILICEIGCVSGIVVGIIIGNLTALVVGASFIIPWMWMGFAIALCLIVGISSGYIPAVRASNLDPIEALRYE